MKLSRVYSYIGSGTTPLSSQEDYYSEEGYNWLQTGDLNNGLITQTSKKITKKAIDEMCIRDRYKSFSHLEQQVLAGKV